jgi:PPOX class probable F420-dependent enzyme
MLNIPDSYQDLLKDETRAYAYLATVMSDGTPQLTPLWFNVEGDHILINSAKGRIKDKNMRARPNIAILISDPKKPFYRWMQIRGRVVEIIEKGAADHISALSLKYEDKPWTLQAGQTRVIYKILPDKVSVNS